MIKRRLVAALTGCAALLPLSGFARQGTPPLSLRIKAQALQAVQQLVVAATDAQAEQAADAKIGVTTPFRFAVPTAVRISPKTDGTWEQVPGGRIWQLRIASAGATDLNFGFSTFWMPDGATLHVYSEDENYFQGPYSARDNKPHGQLWTPMLPGGRAVIEMFVPAEAKEEPRLVLSKVNRGYRDMFHRQKNLSVAKAGACNNDVVCPAGDPWRNEIRSVAVYSLEGSFECTGTLINDTAGDFKNYFLTANHCNINSANAATIVVYWNFQSPVCGEHGGGSLAQNQSGAIFRMAKADVDVTLIELEEIPESSFRVYYSGWDRSGVAPAGAVGIHHPNTDEKSISFANSTLVTVDSCIGTGGIQTHWQVIWNSGVTEPGSSGSGIWDPNTHRLVGTLSGGDSACSNPQGPDCYGKFSVAWNLGTTAAQRLRDWLDPMNSGVTNVAGKDPSTVPLIAAAGSALLAESCSPTNGVIDPGETVTVQLALQNFGGSNTTDLIATLLATNGITSPGAPQAYGVITAGGPPVSRNFSFSAGGLCGNLITAVLQLQDGTNSRGIVSYPFRLGAPHVVFTQSFDNVALPGLPAGWQNAASGGSAGWSTTASRSDTPPASGFAADPASVSDASLTSPTIFITASNAQCAFRHYYNTEVGSEPFDGGVLEIQINNGGFDDIISAGGAFVAGGYNGTISTRYSSPIANRDAWAGDSGSFISTVVNLPPSAAGNNIRLRWRMATDSSTAGEGWYVDTISVADGYDCCHSIVPPQITNVHKNGENIVFSFNTVPGQSYVTEFKSLLSTNAVWNSLQTNNGDGSTKSVTNSAGASQRYFRVKVQ